MPKHRGSLMAGGSFGGRVTAVTQGVFSHTTPNLSNVCIIARLYARELASDAMELVMDSAAEEIQEKLKLAQASKGIKISNENNFQNIKLKRPNLWYHSW